MRTLYCTLSSFFSARLEEPRNTCTRRPHCQGWALIHKGNRKIKCAYSSFPRFLNFSYGCHVVWMMLID